MHLTVKEEEELHTCTWIYTKNKQSRYKTIDDSVVRASERTKHNQCSSKSLVYQMPRRSQPQVSCVCLFENHKVTEGVLPSQPRLLVKCQGCAECQTCCSFFVIALTGVQMLQKNTTKLCSQEVKAFSSTACGIFFFNTMECLEVRKCYLTGYIFLTAWVKTLCQMKVKTCDGQVGRQRSCGLMKQLVADSH